jgi:hypothetical protein
MTFAPDDSAVAKLRCEPPRHHTADGRKRRDHANVFLALGPGMKEVKIGEGTYANVYRGECRRVLVHCRL